MRQIVLDTETTGLDPASGHRLIEIGCVELLNRKLTGGDLHLYVNPGRKVDVQAYEIHGLGDDFLREQPPFTQVVDEFITYIKGAELLIHNAAFDIGFLDNELKLCSHKVTTIKSICSVVDTLEMARSRFPGQRNSLDALCKRLGIDNSSRTLHGALLDSQILAQVYLALSGGQTSLILPPSEPKTTGARVDLGTLAQQPVGVSEADRTAHGDWIALLNENSEARWAALDYPH